MTFERVHMTLLAVIAAMVRNPSKAPRNPCSRQPAT
jgi:hypothetical protein